MTAYLQQGHGSWGLMEEPDLGAYGGLILSPVNDGPANVVTGLRRLRDIRSRIEVILDPQLYNPAADKGKLAEWGYYSTDFGTADHADIGWWSARGREVCDCAAAVEADAVCSPALIPRTFTDEYYRFTVDVANAVNEHASQIGLDTLTTAIVNLRELADPRRAHQIASILSSSDSSRVYLTFLADDLEARQPLNDGASLPTAIHLVKLLSQEQRVHVGFCAHDAALWKAAGAEDVSAGKFFNLRRFTPSRWRNDDSGGRLVSYWNEGKLFTLLRDQDVLRLDREGWFENRSFEANPAGAQILEVLRSNSGDAWQKLSWIQFQRWLSNADATYADPSHTLSRLQASDRAWAEVAGELRILFLDRFNDGSHVRTWLNALNEGLNR